MPQRQPTRHLHRYATCLFLINALTQAYAILCSVWLMHGCPMTQHVHLETIKALTDSDHVLSLVAETFSPCCLLVLLCLLLCLICLCARLWHSSLRETNLALSSTAGGTPKKNGSVFFLPCTAGRHGNCKNTLAIPAIRRSQCRD